MTKSEILKKAEEIVNGEREKDYGNIETNFRKICVLWNDYMNGKKSVTLCPDGTIHSYLTPEDVAVMMILLKVARLSTGKGTDDTYIDIAGYAACGGQLHETQYQ